MKKAKSLIEKADGKIIGAVLNKTQETNHQVIILTMEKRNNNDRYTQSYFNRCG